jgi:transposase InsO family protein
MKQFKLAKPNIRSANWHGKFGFKQKPLEPLEPSEFWRGVAEIAKISEPAKVKLEWMIFYLTVGKSDAYTTAAHFGIAPKTFYKWHKQFKAHGVKGLEERSRKPHHFRQWEVTRDEEAKIKKLRKKHMHYGKTKLKDLYKEEYHEEISTWKIERVVRYHKLFPEPIKHDYQVKKRAKATPKPRIQNLVVKTEPWFLFHLDTIVIYAGSMKRYILTAIDHETRIAYARMYTNKSSRNAKDFLYRLHYLIQADLAHVHTDNGSEFQHEFDQALIELAARHWYSRPNTPKDNPCGERFNKTLQYEWLNDGHFTPDTNRFNGTLTDWLIEYNFHRPHQALDNQRPFEYLQTKLTNNQLLLPMSSASTLI